MPVKKTKTTSNTKKKGVSSKRNISSLKRTFKKAYVVTVDMGYGHQRAAYPLSSMATRPRSIKKSGETDIISANTYPGIPSSDRRKWEGGRGIYETISRFKKVPLLGTGAFALMDYLQRIEPFYPKRDLSHPILQIKQIYSLIKNGWGKDLIDKLNKNPLPFVTTFFSTAFMAEEHGYDGDIYCLCTDTDISRAWVPMDPTKSKIKYFAPTMRVKERLALYGVKKSNIFLTGFPLPKENVGKDRKAETLRRSLGCRIANLDPKGVYQKKYEKSIERYLGLKYCEVKNAHPLTITFAVGGAGAQRDIGLTILKSLHKEIDKGKVRLNLVAGSRREVYDYFDSQVRKLHLEKRHGGSINIIYDPSKHEYFKKFNKALLTTDVLWTKPSELSFFTGLGLPIIMSPTIGSQEVFNRAWLHSIGSGFEQENPEYTHEWLYDWLETGWLAQAAMEGFIDAPIHGTFNIEDIVLRGQNPKSISDSQLI